MFRHCVDCFIVRGRANQRVLQRIQVRDTTLLRDKVTVPPPIVGTWSLLEKSFQEEELPAARKLRRYIGYSSYVLENSETGRHYRIVDIVDRGLPMPRRGGLEIPTGILGGSDEFRKFLTEGTTDWIQPIYPDLADPAFLPHIITPVLDHLHLLNTTLLLSSLSPIPTEESHRPDALKPYVARIIAEQAKINTCPITLDSMILCKTLYVPTCGHVCSDAAVCTFETCPVCRDPVAWTTVTL